MCLYSDANEFNVCCMKKKVGVRILYFPQSSYKYKFLVPWKYFDCSSNSYTGGLICLQLVVTSHLPGKI